MQDVVYYSRGEITFCFEKNPIIGYGVATVTIRQQEIPAPTFEEPNARVLGLLETYGSVSLDSEKNGEIIHHLSECHQSGSKFGLMGIFQKRNSNVAVALRVLANPSSISIKNRDAIVSLINAISFEYPVGELDFSICPESD